MLNTQKPYATRTSSSCCHVLRSPAGQVAFLRIDRRGAGRLGATELRMGLLLGLGLGYSMISLS